MIDNTAPQSVLVADDDAIIHAIFHRILAPFGARLIACRDGAEAFEKATAELPDIVFLDVGMPGLDGLEVCRRLREHSATSTTPILFLSSRTQSDARLAGLRLGANDYLTKPMDRAEVEAKVRTYLQLSRLQKRMLEMERRRAVQGLLRGVAHHFNNILCGLSGSAQLLEMRLKTQPNLAQLCHTIIGYSQRAATISQQLLVLAGARGETLETGQAQLEQAVRIAWEAALSGTARQHQLEQNGNTDLAIRIALGSADIQTSLFHLFKNAIQATPQGGVIRLGMVQEEKDLVLVVSDEGCGMPADLLDEALQPFSQNRDQPSSTGMGLPFVKALAEQAEGSLQLESHSGLGTSATLRLPLLPALV